MAPLQLLRPPSPAPSARRGVAVCANFALNLTTTLLNGPLVESIGQAALFGFFGFMCIVSLIFVHRAVPETKGKSLEQIEAMMRGDE